MLGTHALIIDDTPVSIDVLSMLLKNEGIDSLALASPNDLADAIECMPPIAMVFLDLEIPNYDGFEILDQLRGMEYMSGVPIIAYTVHTSEMDAARKAGFDGFLGKPIRASAFADQLQRIRNREPVWE